MAFHRIALLVAPALLAAACNNSPTTPPTPTNGLAGLTLTPSSVVAGSNAQGVVMLVSAAPASGASVTLSSNAGWTTIPSTVTVPANATSATFTVTTSSTLENAVTATITASYGNSTVTTTLTATPAPKTVVNLAINPTSVTGGNASQGTITLSTAAPSGGAVVALSSSNTSAAMVPSTVSLPAGSTTATFAITTFSTTAGADVTIVASYGGASKTASLTVMPQVALLTALTVSPSSVTGGQPAQATVTLSTPAAPGGAFIALSSSRASVNVPSVVIVTAGATTATFTITTATVSAAAEALIAASYGGTTRTATLQVTP